VQHKPPTTVRISSEESSVDIVQLLTARLCELGYDILLDHKFTPHPFFSRCYNVYFCHKTTPADYWFYIIAHNIHWTGNYCVLKHKDVALLDFVDYTIYLWGLSRGGRFPYSGIHIVDPNDIAAWKLRDLI
jgi:hypothetical protein